MDARLSRQGTGGSSWEPAQCGRRPVPRPREALPPPMRRAQTAPTFCAPQALCLAAYAAGRNAPCQLEPCAAVQPKQCAAVAMGARRSRSSSRVSTSKTVRPGRPRGSSSCWLKSQS